MVKTLYVDDDVESSDVETLRQKVRELTLRLDEVEKRENELRRLEAELYMGQAQICEAIVEAIEAKDKYTSGHSRRVAELSLQIGAALKLDRMRLWKLRIAAILHDVGKIGTLDGSLTKESRLDDREYLQLKEHPVTGQRIIQNIELFADIGRIVRWHHERYDGTGYPDGLPGDGIPLESAIICVADAYDAITTKRTYNKKMTFEEAVDEIMRHSGTQFNPRVVEALRTALLPNQLGSISLQDSDLPEEFEIPDAEA